jgi:hypothetical protein
VFGRNVALAFVACVAGCGAQATPSPRRPEAPKPLIPAIPVIATPPVISTGTTPVENSSPAPIGASWGTADPVSLVAASPDRRWLAVCQARTDNNGDGRVLAEVGAQGELRGDRLDGYYLDEPGGGIRIDAFGGADPSGRFVAFVVGDRLVLRDTQTREETNLAGADLRDDRGSFTRPRGVSFDPTGRRLLYLRKNGAGDDIVVRELATGTEAVIAPGVGDLWRADFDPSGEFVVAKVVVSDTNGNGRLDWPSPQALGPWMRCALPLPRYATWERPGDDITSRIAPASGGPAVDAPGLIVPFADGYVQRDGEGTIVLAKPAGQRSTMVAKKSCAGKLLHADAPRGLLVVTCENKKGRSEVRFIARGTDRPLVGVELLAPAGDHWAPPGSNLLPLYPGSDAVLVDLRNADTTRLSPGDRVIAVADERALILRGRSLVLYKKGTTERILETAVDPLAHMLRAGSVVALPPAIVDVATGEVAGRIDARALAVSRDGAFLVPRGGTADATRLAVGPLVWETQGQRGNVTAVSSRAPELSPEPPSVLPMGTPPAK